MRSLALMFCLAATPLAAQTCLDDFPMLPEPLDGWEIADRGEFQFNAEEGGAALYIVSRPEADSFPNDQYQTLDDWIRAEEHTVSVRVTKGADVANMRRMLTDPLFATMTQEGPLGYPRMGMAGDGGVPLQTVMGDWQVYISGDLEPAEAHFIGVLRCAAAQGQLLEGYELPPED